MTPLETYALFQINDILDFIKAVSFGALLISSGVCLILGIIWLCETEGGANTEGNRSTDGSTLLGMKGWIKRHFYILIISLITMVLCNALPDRNTIIAMKVIPYITSEQNMATLNEESKEIYMTFKDWVKSQIQPIEAPK